MTYLLPLVVKNSHLLPSRLLRSGSGSQPSQPLSLWLFSKMIPWTQAPVSWHPTKQAGLLQRGSLGVGTQHRTLAQGDVPRSNGTRHGHASFNHMMQEGMHLNSWTDYFWNLPYNIFWIQLWITEECKGVHVHMYVWYTAENTARALFPVNLYKKHE